ncbi:MAG: MlaD family protein [Verrucomicrobiota bacterium]|jgi:phospholipid/cholesterol/gamma-HCH transport system substrate-binding protein
MNDSRFAWKVGVFVFVGAALAAFLILNFTKGNTTFRSTYKLRVTMPNVAGLKPAADVMIAGVPVGKVMDTTLSLDGRSVLITVEVLAKYQIPRNAIFHIDSQGFLGDQYIEVTPPEAKPEQAVLLLTNGELVVGEPPFNMQEAVRSVNGLFEEARKAIKDIDTAVTNVNQSVLTTNTLYHISLALSNFDAVTADAAVMAREVRGMIDSNGAPVHVAITNFVTFSQSLNDMVDALRATVSTNSGNITVTMSNLTYASGKITNLVANVQALVDDLQAGRGVAGGLLKDDQMKEQLGAFLTNASAMTEEFSQFALRLNQNGIWRTLWKPKTPATNAPSR